MEWIWMLLREFVLFNRFVCESLGVCASGLYIKTNHFIECHLRTQLK